MNKKQVKNNLPCPELEHTVRKPMKQINESQKLIARIHHVNMEKKQSDETYAKKPWAKTDHI